MSIANPNWLTVAGLLYSGIGVVLLATAIATTASSANLARSARALAGVGIGGIGTFGGLLAGVGFFIQSIAQLYNVPQGGAVAFTMISLIALLGAYGIAALRSPSTGKDAVENRVTISPPQPVETSPATNTPAAVKLVSSSG